MQVHRVTNMYGEQCEDVINSSTVLSNEVLSETEIVYAQVDGGMVLTREKK